MYASLDHLPIFLRLPVELRLQIYDYAIPPRSITMTGSIGYWDPNARTTEEGSPGAVRGQELVTAEGFNKDLIMPDSLKGHLEEYIPVRRHTSNLPPDNPRPRSRGWRREATSNPRCNMDVGTPPSMPPQVFPSGSPIAYASTKDTLDMPSARILRSSVQALHLTHPQIHEELLLHRPKYNTYYRHIDLALSYPAGVTLVSDHFPDLLKHTRNIRIYGMSSLSENDGQAFERMQDTQGYMWEKVGITSKEPEKVGTASKDPYQATPGDLLARHHINSLASIVARLLGKAAHEEEESYHDRLAAKLTKDAPEQSERRLSFSSIPLPQDESPSTASTRSSSPDSAEDETNVDLSLTPAPGPSAAPSVLTIDPPPPRNRPSSPDPPSPSSPTLHLRVFHPQAQNSSVYHLVWSHVFSPITIAMSNVYGGHINLAVARGDRGVGVAADIKGNGGMGRQVCSRWPMLERGDDGRGWLFEGKTLDGVDDPARGVRYM